MAENGNPSGPHVQLAAFCSTTLQEANGSLSVIRIIDRQLVVGSTPEMLPTIVQLTLAIILKAGDLRQKATISLRTTTPSQKVLPGPEVPGLFEGDERGIQLILPMAMPMQEEGLYWFDVMVEGIVLTRIPLRIMYHRVQIGTAASGLGMPPPPGS